MTNCFKDRHATVTSKSKVKVPADGCAPLLSYSGLETTIAYKNVVMESLLNVLISLLAKVTKNPGVVGAGVRVSST